MAVEENQNYLACVRDHDPVGEVKVISMETVVLEEVILSESLCDDHGVRRGTFVVVVERVEVVVGVVR